MEYLKINKEDAINMYNNGSDEVKNALVEMFGKDAFGHKFDDSIKTWKDVCNKLGISANQHVVCEQLDKKAFCKALALYKLIAIQTAINNEVEFDENGYSYYPYWDFRFMDEKELPNGRYTNVWTSAIVMKICMAKLYFLWERIVAKKVKELIMDFQ